MKAVFAILLVALAGLSGVCSAATRIVTLAVPGMTCPLCPITVKKALERVAGVSTITPDLARKTIAVRYDDARTNPAALTHATTDAGYPSTVVSTSGMKHD